ncbi:hypothetical protein QBC34DRAFT_402932 [Podospora aff. communis PSN243]|uniref:Uncharacterized protein n=1 Tax=Podospora aff. communis PSN243 TaxID=3040156 RepID=A0AAV9GVM3_9PEZI|nr:hypothetical protein QBC34DRAFT_402932 [Podospora aff. communis PSN243]
MRRSGLLGWSLLGWGFLGWGFLGWGLLGRLGWALFLVVIGHDMDDIDLLLFIGLGLVILCLSLSRGARRGGRDPAAMGGLRLSTKRPDGRCLGSLCLGTPDPGTVGLGGSTASPWQGTTGNELEFVVEACRRYLLGLDSDRREQVQVVVVVTVQARSGWA